MELFRLKKSNNQMNLFCTFLVTNRPKNIMM